MRKNKSKIFLIIMGMRPIQFTKNFLVFSAPLFSFKFNTEIWLNALFSFFAFCFISGATYLINDTLDIEEDRLHKKKRFRVLAAGLISPKEALFSAILIIGFVFSVSIFFNFLLFTFLVTYLILQILYSNGLKNIPLIELFLVASGFVLRTLSGGVASSLVISPWFMISVGLISMFLVVEKRKGELFVSKKNQSITRKVLNKYSYGLLQKYETLLASCAFFTYALWASGPIMNGAPSRWMILTVPLVLLGIFRYQFISEESINALKKNESFRFSLEEPEKVLFSDNFIRSIILIWLICVLVIGIFV